MKRKLKSNSGASMILALALMLICVMVSSTIIASAASGTSRAIRRTEQQQDYLAVSAASDLIAKNINGAGEFIGTIEIRVKDCQQYNNPATVMYKGSPTTGYWVTIPPVANVYAYYIVDDLCNEVNVKSVHADTEFKEGPFGVLMQTAATHVYMNESAYTQTFTISIPQEEAGKDRLPAVNCTFTMTKNYDVSIYITSENPDIAYAIEIELHPTIVEDKTGDTQTITCEHMVYYKQEVNGSLVAVEPAEKQVFSYTATAPETHVTWGTPVITKEVDAQ